jgi:hypothetical protein
MSIILNVINYFWKLGFNEEEADLYVKAYADGHRIQIDVAAETLDYGEQVAVEDSSLTLFSQRNFVVMESVDRLLRRGWSPRALRLGGNAGWDYSVSCDAGHAPIAVRCAIWEDEYDEIVAAVEASSGWPTALMAEDQGIRFFVAYTSRLKAGIIGHRFAVFPKSQRLRALDGSSWTKAFSLFEENGISAGSAADPGSSEAGAVRTDDLVISGDVLTGYSGQKEVVVVPRPVARLKNGVFWNTETLVDVSLPEGLLSMGGDTFYNCVRLARLTIPSTVEVIGDNPFANCPALDMENRSPRFKLENGLLLNHEGTRLVYCAIKGDDTEVVVPHGVYSIGKHAFYNCQRLEKITLAPTVRIIENNPFSNLPRLRIENQSPHFVFQDGALYNATFGTLFYYEHGWDADHLRIPDGVRIIGRHSFYNCRSLRRLVIPSSVTTIGYNPFAGCSSLTIENHSPAYVYVDGALYDQGMTELVHYSISSLAKEFRVPDTVRRIDRSAFFQSRHLQRVHLPEGLTTIERSAFAGCVELRAVNIPESVTSIGEWAFSLCPHLERPRLAAHTSYEAHTFAGSPSNSRRQGAVT